MNNIFSFQRFLWLFNKHTKEHYKAYLMSTVVLTGMLAIILVYIAIMGGLDNKTQHLVFGSLLVGTGFIFTSGIFYDLGDKQRSVSSLTLPVAHLERFLVAWIYSFIIFQIVYVACFFLINSIAVNLNVIKTEGYKAISLLWGKESVYFTALVYYCFFHALAFVGAILFKKGHFIKTAFTFLIFFIILMILNKALGGFIFNSQVRSSGIPFTSIDIMEVNGNGRLNAKAWFTPILTSIVLVSAASLWAATYFKLKEKQV